MIFDLQLSHVSVSQDTDQGQSARQTEILHVQGVFPDIFSLWPSLCRSVLVKTDMVQQGRELLWSLGSPQLFDCIWKAVGVAHSEELPGKRLVAVWIGTNSIRHR